MEKLIDGFMDPSQGSRGKVDVMEWRGRRGRLNE